MANEIIDVTPNDSLKTWGWVSYVLHLIVAVAAVLPGAQVSVFLLLIALVIDLVKRDEAAGTWQASHFSWRIRSVLWAGVLYLLTSWLWLLLLVLVLLLFLPDLGELVLLDGDERPLLGGCPGS